MIELVIPEYQNCVRYTEKNFWPYVIMSNELNEFINNNLPKLSYMESIYWVVGRRGSGKSQVLEIVARKCIENYKNWGVLPIIASIYGLDKDPKPSEVLGVACQSIAKSLIYLYEDFKSAIDSIENNIENDIIDWNVELILKKLTEYQDKFSPDKFSDIHALEKLLKQISQGRIGYLLLIDEIDKIEPLSYFNFLLQNQTFFSTLINLKAKMIISMSTEVFRLIQDKKVEEANFFRGRTISPPVIQTAEQCKELIESRIRMKKADWRSPFDEESYMIILKKCDGIPRDILRETGNILQKGWEKRLTVIPHAFVESYFETMERDAEFESYIKQIIGEIGPIRIFLNELSSNPTYPRIIQAFLLNPYAARRGEYITLQALGGIGLDKSKYLLIIEEMKRKGLLRDRGYGPEIVDDLYKFIEDVSKKWNKTPIDIYNAIVKLDKDYLPPPKIVSSVEIFEQIDNAIKDIITKNPFLSYSEIYDYLANYKSGTELEKWRKVLPLRLSDLEKSGTIVAIGNGHDAKYVLEIGGLTKEVINFIEDVNVLRQLKSIDTLKSSSDKKTITDNILALVRNEIFCRLGIGSQDDSNNELLMKIRNKGYSEIENYFTMLMNAIKLEDDELAYQIAIKLIIQCMNIKLKKQNFISALTQGMTQLKLEDITKEILSIYENEDLINEILLNINLDYITITGINTNINIKTLYLERGNIFECQCGMKFISDGKEAYHIACKRLMQKIGDCFYYIDEENKVKFIISLILTIVKKFLQDKQINISNYISNDGTFICLIEYDSENICITNNLSLRNDTLEYPLKIITLDIKNNKKFQTYSGIKDIIYQIIKSDKPK